MGNRIRGMLIAASLLGTGCGGGGGEGGAPEPPPAPITPAPPPVSEEGIRFTEVSDAGFTRAFTADILTMTPSERFSGGVASGDYDGDGDVDLYVVGGHAEPNHLYQNQGDGTYVEVGASVGLDVVHRGSGPAFGDVDGDGDIDLFVGACEGDAVHLFENRVAETGRFVNVTRASGIEITAANTVSATFYDYDGDGFLDLFLAHWAAARAVGEDTETVWRNNGDFTFTSTSLETGVAAVVLDAGADWTYTPTLADIDGDGDGDLLMVSDFETTEVLLNNGDGTFVGATDRDVIVDQNGMGSAVGDYDNDGDLDWFVTSIYNLDVDGNRFGNRFYRNEGAGVFTDITETLGIEDGGWGWASCFADVDNDGWLDIFHVNGWNFELDKDFTSDEFRFFHAQGNGEFVERAAEVNLANEGQGRGVACFDVERDGDIDFVVVNNSPDHLVYYRNDSTNENHYLGIKLRSLGTNRLGVGAWVTVRTEEHTQLRELRAGNNFVSHNPMEVHFGLGAATEADVLVRWPDGNGTEFKNVAADQWITLVQEESAALRLNIVRGSGDGNYVEGERIEVRAEPAGDNYYFSHWSSSGGGSFDDANSPETSFVMPGNAVTLLANYVPGVAMDADVSVARRWNEMLLQAIRNDWARPTVHARNLFHTSAAAYDVWAALSDVATPWLLGRTRSGVNCTLAAFLQPDAEDVEAARAEALSYAFYRIIRQRFRRSPGVARIRRDADALMGALGYDPALDSTDYSTGSPASLGNHVAACYLDFGLLDGANEANDYENRFYEPVNPPLRPELPGNPDIVDLNRWQPLALERFIDQAGNPVQSQPDFLSPEWGEVVPFALAEADRVAYERDGATYLVYHDPGAPPSAEGPLADQYDWGFSLVAVWSSHLSPSDGEMIDISPSSLGNIRSYPTSFSEYPEFYDLIDGGDPGDGHAANPVTGAPYEPQLVPRGDYARVLAEFWADGPDSETPPGHWFAILNEVNDHELLERRFGGAGPSLNKLEWDVKGYFALGGAMHDAAVAAWAVKGWYDYIRPISAVRAMADKGQNSDPDRSSYDVDGIPLRSGLVELVEADDALAGDAEEHVGKIKVRAWRGPDHIGDPLTDEAGVGWILAENWWPYQRPSFVTPPFAGYVSGHSTYSRAAAEVLTSLTGDPFFPGGMSGFEIPRNEFLVFERGPSVDMTLQWATYRDASDQCSLSRIWGGIHPPADDIPGRLIGIRIGTEAFALAETYFSGTAQ